VAHLVFVQATTGRLPEGALRRNAATHFDASIALTEQSSAPGAYFVELIVGAERAKFMVQTRSVTDADITFAAEAEARGRAAGMAALAARCAYVWVVTPDAAAPEWFTWECCALLALTALGPVLPEDRSTLLGVRSARARAERLRTSR
jgi:hypothetical protein